MPNQDVRHLVETLFDASPTKAKRANRPVFHWHAPGLPVLSIACDRCYRKNRIGLTDHQGQKTWPYYLQASESRQISVTVEVHLVIEEFMIQVFGYSQHGGR